MAASFCWNGFLYLFTPTHTFVGVHRVTQVDTRGEKKKTSMMGPESSLQNKQMNKEKEKSPAVVVCTCAA